MKILKFLRIKPNPRIRIFFSKIREIIPNFWLCKNHSLEIQEDWFFYFTLVYFENSPPWSVNGCQEKYSRSTFKMSSMMICQILIVFAHFQNRSLILNCSEIPQRARINYSVIQSDISFPHHSKKISNFSILTNFIFRIITWSSNHSNDHGFNSRSIYFEMQLFGLPGLLTNPSFTWPPILSRISRIFSWNFINYFQWI